MDKNKIIYISGGSLAVLLILYFLFFTGGLEGRIVLPYISHQSPQIDPHLPSSNELSDNLDEVLFDGLFNKSATQSGVIFEDGLGSLISFTNNVAKIRVNTNRLWHSSYTMEGEGEDVTLKEVSPKKVNLEDIRFSLQRIQRLKSLSPDYVMVYQALDRFDFDVINANEISFKFKSDRIWTETEVKECLAFKVIPKDTKIDQTENFIGSGSYIKTSEIENERFHKNNPSVKTNLSNFILKPFIDNSTYATELDNENINVLFSTPYGSINSSLEDTSKFFYKSNISTTYFTILFNTERVDLNKRKKFRALINNKNVMDRFYRVGTPQQRHIIDYKNNKDNYSSYLNASVFPNSSYYVSEKIVSPQKVAHANSYNGGDTLHIKVSLNHSFKEELAELTDVLNDKALYGNYIKVTPAQNEDLITGNYDAILVPIEGYRSNFLIDLYDVFFREPDLNRYKINLPKSGENLNISEINSSQNFFRLSGNDAKELFETVYNFMSTSEIGDKQYYSAEIDRQEHDLSLGIWLFSLPSITYFSTQFDETSIQLYGTASKLSTIKEWRERPEK